MTIFSSNQWSCIVCLALVKQCWSITCDEGFECLNQTVSQENGAALYATGFMSAAFGNIYNENENGGESTYCWASRSCQSLDKYTSKGALYTHDTRGYLSLAWTKLVIDKSDNDATIYDWCYCESEASCFEIDSFVAHCRYIQCSGSRSCNNVNKIYNISGTYTDNFYAAGTFAMINTEMYTMGDGSYIVFNFWGYYAGYNASLYCNNGDTCKLDCHTNGCVNLNFYCNETVSTCIVDCDNGYCPNNWNNSNNTNEANDNARDIYKSISLIDENGYDGEILKLLNKTYDEFDFYENCIENGEYTCINTHECDNRAISDNNVIITNPICCLATYSCIRATINVNNINSDIYCDASYSCHNIEINLNYQSILYVRASYGLTGNSIIENFNKIIATGFHSCEKIEIKNGNYLGCFGERSCYYSTIINVTNIYATGYKALDGSKIYSNGSDINLYILGYRSAIYITLYCNAGDKCDVICLNNTYNDECLDNIKYETTKPTQAPTQSPTAAPSDEYANYVLMMNVSRKNASSSVNRNTIAFHVKLEGSNEDTDWLTMKMNESSIPVNNEWVYFNYSFNWTNVGYSNSILTMVTYDENDILFDCFFVYLNENDKTYEQSVCQTDTTISVNREGLENGYCEYATIDFVKESIKVKSSDENTGCLYTVAVESNDESTESSNSYNTIEFIIGIITDTVKYIVICCISCGILLAIMSKLMAKYVANYATDAPPTSKIFKFFLHMSDFWSDIGLTLVWYLSGKFIFAAISSAALLSSIFVSGLGAITLVAKWIHYHNFSNDCPYRLVNYVKSYHRTIYLLALMAGLKPTIFLLQSKLFYHPLFNIPLKENELEALYKYQVSVVIVETLPEFIMQFAYLGVYGVSGNQHTLSLLFISMVTSAVSILVEFMVFIGHTQDDLATRKLSKETIYNFNFAIKSRKLRYYHIMTNGKLNRCLDVIFKDKNQPWQSTAQLCKFTSECYYVENKLTSHEIDVHCQIVISTSEDDLQRMEVALNECVKSMFDESNENHQKLKEAICSKLNLEFSETSINRAKNMVLTHADHSKGRTLSEMKAISTFNVHSTSANSISNDEVIANSIVNSHEMAMEGHNIKYDNDATKTSN